MHPREILVYIGIPASFAGVSFAEHTYARTVSHDPTRKHFFAKIIGLIAAAGLAPRLLAKAPAQPAQTPVASGGIELRPETRAVARRADSV